ncbi:MAG: leucyl/phenylalanyl-tRNA--protein transferase [Verrucomicrobia bacterium]|nr:leucyl/phenylalanyl-tRNA--protein transferase [Verrucomicrobiota bacterium]
MIQVLGKKLAFPDPRHLKFEPEPGLVAVGGDFSVERLLLAYRNGIFPWTDDPITWWSPNPRAIFEFDQFHVSRSLQKLAKQCVVLEEHEPVGSNQDAPFEITINRAFSQVIEHCATSRNVGNWITSEFVKAYTKLHAAGHAHSLEVWHKRELAGGIYGVAIGGFFAGESMFHFVSNASKVALYFLCERLRERGYKLFDLQVVTPTTKQFGAVEISRDEYLDRLKTALFVPVAFH